MLIYIIIIVVAIIIVYALSQYNNFIKLDNKVKEAFSTMDIYLKKRWDLIPNIVDTVKGYAKHEKDTLESIIGIRSGAYDNMKLDEKIAKNEEINKGINKLMAIAEAYPDLKANENFKDLSKQLTKVEDEIAQSRKYYNATVRVFNNKVEMFPSNIFANIFGYKRRSMFAITDEEKNNIKVEL